MGVQTGEGMMPRPQERQRKWVGLAGRAESVGWVQPVG